MVVDAILNSSEPISGTTVRSNPTMPPTKALIRISSENCCQFSRRPSRIPEGAGADDSVGMLIASHDQRPERRSAR